jgi:apolipoprotein N-acyltransferase
VTEGAGAVAPTGSDRGPALGLPSPPVLGGVGGLLLAVGLPPFPVLLLALVGVGVVVLALHRAATLHEAALAGALFAGVASLVALHWIPAAAEPYLGVGSALLAGGTAWLLHAACGALVLAMAHALREDLPLALRGGAALGILEWLPGALPVVGIPWFTGAAALDGSFFLPLVAVVGGSGVVVLAAAAWGSGLSWRRERKTGVAVALAWAGAGVGALLLPPVEAPLTELSRTELPRTELTGERPSGAGLPGSEEEGRLQDAPAPGGFHRPEDPRLFAALSWDRTREETPDPEALRRGVAQLIQEAGEAASAGGPLDPERGIRLLWPEAPLSTIPAEDPLAMAWLQAVQQGGEPLGGVAGIHAVVGGRRYNTLVRTGARDEAPEGIHRKRFLVPGVERTALLSPGSGEGRGLAPGAGALPFDWGGIRAGGIICFEILFPVEGARLRRRGAEVLVQATSDGMLRSGGRLPVWADAGRRQHEAMARFRAAEFRIPLVRAALGGRALAVDARGRELVPLERHPLGRGEWIVVQLPPPPPPPPAAWVVPLLGPLLLGLLGIPLVFRWRRGQVLGVRRPPRRSG